MYGYIAPNHSGKTPLIATPMAASAKLNNVVEVTACRNTLRAPCISPAPILCATCTENPVDDAMHSPQNNHVVVETRPMAAASSAPRLPTIAASIYCITIEESCATTAGTLNITVKCICWPKVIGLPSRIRASKPVLVSLLRVISYY